MTFIDDTSTEIISTNLDDTNLGYLTDDFFSTTAEKDGDITFTVRNRGYKYFAFMNTYCSRIEFIFKDDSGNEQMTYSHPMYINAAKNCRELLAGVHSVIADHALVQFDTAYSGTVDITLKAENNLCKIGKFTYGVPKKIGELKWEYYFEEVETEKIGLTEDDPDKIVERFELVDANAYIETAQVANVRQVIKSVKGKKLVWIEPASGVVVWGKLINSRITVGNPTSSNVHIVIKGIG